jgi:hypothetical protein
VCALGLFLLSTGPATAASPPPSSVTRPQTATERSLLRDTLPPFLGSLGASALLAAAGVAADRLRTRGSARRPAGRADERKGIAPAKD